MKRRLFLMGTLALIVTGGIFWSCQKEEIISDSESLLKKAKVVTTVAEEIALNYPAEVSVNADFEISFSSGCGKLLIERGYILDSDEVTKIYHGLTCEMENLNWEELASGGYSNCIGDTHTQNLPEAGTYVYRTKWNANAENNSECLNCGSFNGNKTACFVIEAINDCQNWQTETAFGGEASGAGSSWWFYYNGAGEEKIYAGQDIEIGTVEYVDGRMIISLVDGWELNPVEIKDEVEVENTEPVKIQGYLADELPTGRPAAGKFTTYKGTSLNPEIGASDFYVIHLDVRKCADDN